VVVRVRDDGIGIGQEMLPRVFDLFAQADRSLERSQGGLGIGLTLVKRLVEMHGGRVEVHSDGLGHGSEFVVRLPATAKEPAVPAARSDPNNLSETASPVGRRILVVDDNADAAVSLSMFLRLKGHEVQVAHDGTAGLAAASSYRPDVAFLDIGMPGMDGYELARRIRLDPDLKSVALVALTGWGQEEDRRRSSEAGFDHHLVKPVDPDDLRQLLESLLARSCETLLRACLWMGQEARTIIS
jgi:CheY-like chemotaxis protein